MLRAATTLLVAVPCIALAETARLTENIPVASLPASSEYGLTNVYRLNNAWITAVIAPDAGRIVELSVGGSNNMLRVDAGLLARAPEAKSSDDWRNYGGDWLWPVAQSRWNLMQKGDWPPPELFRNTPWKSRAWENEDGAKCCLLSQEFGEPLNIRVSRLIRVDPHQPEIEIHQRIVRTAASKIPVCLWQISQVGGATEVRWPAGQPYKLIAFDPLPATMATETNQLLHFDLSQASEHKVESSSEGISAAKGDTVLTAFAEGATTTFYSNKGLGYTEIETMSAERDLAPGEKMENTVRLGIAPKR